LNHFAIIVCYHPNLDKLKLLIRNILDCQFRVILVDNTENNNLIKIPSDNRIFLVSNGENLGIAIAQNIGVNLAIKNKAEIISFFDQDSELYKDTLSSLLNFVNLNNNSIAVPTILNKNTNQEYPNFKFGNFGKLNKIFSLKHKQPKKIDIAISSGTTLKTTTFLKIGFFDEAFFIDFVDIEWFYRAKKKKVDLFVIPFAIIRHSIGIKNKRVLFFIITIHSPIRTYYKVRNSFLLFKKKLNLLFVIRQILPALIHNLLLSCFSDSKKLYLKYFFLGIFDGLRGKEGKLHSKVYEKS